MFLWFDRFPATSDIVVWRSPRVPLTHHKALSDNIMDMEEYARIDITKEYLHFSAAHFTVFSDSHRENLHGHNFQVEATLDGPIGDDGLCFDYNIIKSKLKKICDSLDERVLLPERSPHLQLVKDGDYTVAEFNNERLPFLHRDVKSIPVRNITVEELAHWFMSVLRQDEDVSNLPIKRMQLRISSGPGQWASTSWNST